MIENTLLIEYGLPAFFLLVIIREVIPIIRSLLEKLLPERIKKIKTNEDRLIEIQEKDLDLKERAIAANETIAKVLIILEKNQIHMMSDINELEQHVRGMISTLNVLSENLAVLLDRNMRLRTDDYKKKGE